jgi:hypothetical protein
MEEQEMEEQEMEEQEMEEQEQKTDEQDVGAGNFRDSESIPATLFRMLQPSITIE